MNETTLTQRQLAAHGVREGRRRARREAALAAGAAGVQDALAQHPRNVRMQVACFFGNFDVPATNGRMRAVAFETQLTYVRVLNLMLDGLGKMNIRLQNLSDLTPKHVVKVVQVWERAGLSASTLKTRWTVMTRMLGWLGKQPRSGPMRLDAVIKNRERTRRSYSATEPRTFASANVGFEEVLKNVARIDPIAGLHLQLQRTFGLRLKEAVCLNPFESDKGGVLSLFRGTKGGRERDVPIDSQQKRDLLEAVKTAALPLNKGILSYPGLTLVQSKNRYYYVLRKCGMTKKDLGVTSHSCRREFGIERYELIGGRKAPVLGATTSLTQQDRRRDREVRLQLAEELGHSRPQIAAAYVGSTTHMKHFYLENIKRWITSLESAEAVRFVMQRHSSIAFKSGEQMILSLGGEQAQGKPLACGSVAFFVLEYRSFEQGRVPVQSEFDSSSLSPSRTVLHLRAAAVASVELEPALAAVMGVPCRIVAKETLAAYTDGVTETVQLDFGGPVSASGSMSMVAPLACHLG